MTTPDFGWGLLHRCPGSVPHRRCRGRGSASISRAGGDSGKRRECQSRPPGKPTPAVLLGVSRVPRWVRPRRSHRSDERGRAGRRRCHRSRERRGAARSQTLLWATRNPPSRDRTRPRPGPHQGQEPQRLTRRAVLVSVDSRRRQRRQGQHHRRDRRTRADLSHRPQAHGRRTRVKGRVTFTGRTRSQAHHRHLQP